jgi:hypothetical protein
MAASEDHLKLIIQRFDTYIVNANTKGAFLLAFNTFLCGGLLSNYQTLKTIVRPCLEIYMQIALLIIFVMGIVSLIIVLLAVYPFLSSGNSSKDKYHSLIYFGSVSEFNNAEEYADKLQEQEKLDSYKDLAHQIYQLAKGLKKKYLYLEWATISIFIQLFIVAVIIGFVTFNNL